MTNRIEEVTSVKVTRETVAPQIIIEWNPVDNSGYVSFCLRDMIWEDDVYKGMGPQKTLKNLGAGDSIRVPIQHIMEANIPVNGTTFSGQLLMAMIKSYFNIAWDEAKYIQDNPPAVPDMVVPDESQTVSPEPETDPAQLDLGV